MPCFPWAGINPGIFPASVCAGLFLRGCAPWESFPSSVSDICKRECMSYSPKNAPCRAQKTGPIGETYGNKVSRYFSIPLLILGFSKVCKCCKWLLKAWKWFPILCLLFLDFASFNKFGVFEPLFYVEIL